MHFGDEDSLSDLEVGANGGENDGGVTLVLDGHGYSWVDKKVLRVE